MDRHALRWLMRRRAAYLIRVAIRGKGFKVSDLTARQMNELVDELLLNKRQRANIYHWVWRHYTRGQP